MKASQIAALVDGILDGGDDPDLTAVAPLDRAGPTDLSLLAHPRYLTYLDGSRAGAVLVSQSLAPQAVTSRPRIRVANVHLALAAVLPELYPEAAAPAGVHPSAVMGRGVRIGKAVRIEAHAVVGENARIGDRVVIGAGCVVGADCVLGEGSRLHANVTLYPGTQIGRRTILHSGVRAGVDGFGYAPGQDGLRKIQHVGGCLIGDDVEIGANSTIDRGSIGATEIGDGVKIDNLVHIGHNVKVGANSIIVAQVGIAGSTQLGERVTLGGQVGVNGHVHIGAGATIGGQSTVFGDIPPGVHYSGYPARPHTASMRAQAALFKVPELMKRLRALERAVLGRSGADD